MYTIDSCQQTLDKEIDTYDQEEFFNRKCVQKELQATNTTTSLKTEWVRSQRLLWGTSDGSERVQ